MIDRFTAGPLFFVAFACASVSAGAQEAEAKNPEYRLGILLFEGFELLDVMGPAEMFGNVGPRLEVVTVAEKAGEVASAQRVKGVADYSLADCPPLDFILVPGGRGVREAVKNETLMSWFKSRAGEAELTMSVCTGTMMLSEAGLIDGRKATTNKMAFKMIAANRPQVEWIREARWVDDGNIVTSSGVSAGIDMSLHVIARIFGEKMAERIMKGTEFNWQRDSTVDPFAKLSE